MAERVHPSAGDPAPLSPPPGDYIIQVPKDQTYRLPPPENQRRFDRYTRKSRRRRSCCCFFSLLLLLLLLLAGVSAAVLYLVFRPKAPIYSIDSLSVEGIDLNLTASSDRAFSPAMNASVRAENPNGKIGLYYRRGSSSSIDVYYAGVPLCRGVWPAFHQGARNVTVVQLGLTGPAVTLSAAMRAAMAEEQRKGKVPLEVDVKVPLRIKLGELKLWKMTARVRCEVKVDRLSPEAKVVEEDCRVKVDVV